MPKFGNVGVGDSIILTLPLKELRILKLLKVLLVYTVLGFVMLHYTVRTLGRSLYCI